MTVKQFFRSTSFKCIITLLCVLLVSGIFLTVMNSLLKVSDQEKLDRAIKKIYGTSVKTEAIITSDDPDEEYDNYIIKEAYRVKDDGNYLIKSTGKGGYDGGSVTCWIVIEISGGAVSGVGKVVIDSNVGQSYIDRVGSKALNQFSELYEDRIDFSYTPALITGATVMGTKNAICNAVNGALIFVKARTGGMATEAQLLLNNLANIYGDKKISVYGSDGKGNDVLISESDESVTSFIPSEVKLGNATIHSLYKVKYLDGEKEVLNYVVSSTGTGGYADGTVTMLTALTIENGAIKGVYKTIITGNVNQSYIDRVTDKALDQFSEFYEDGINYTPGLITGATVTLTKNAICNAVNGALKYVEQNIGKLYTDEIVDEGGQD